MARGTIDFFHRRRYRSAVGMLIIAAAVATGGCGESSSGVSAGPSSVTCEVALGSPATLDASGGRGSFSVTAEPECAWEASSAVSWISAVSPGSGKGSGTIAFTVAPNETGTSRDGSIIVNGQQVVVAQRGGSSAPSSPTPPPPPSPPSPPPPSPEPPSPSPPSPPSPGPAPSPPSPDPPAPAPTPPAPTPPAPTPACTYSIAPSSQSVAAAASTGTVTVTAGAGCAWTATSNASWITITSGASGSGNGPVGFSVAANTGAARAGTATIATQTFTVTQAAGAAPCTYSISPTEANIGPDAAQGTVSVITGEGCSWTAASNTSWITVTSGASGSGRGTVVLSLTANTGAERTGTVTIATQTFTVTQRAFTPACTYSISPTSMSVGPGAASGTVSLTTADGCSWTTVSSGAWITVTQGVSGSGNGVIAYSVAANTGAARTGTLTIGGQVFTLNQAAVASSETTSEGRQSP